jgi:anhydro-N-acetylmuramic acid kinase
MRADHPLGRLWRRLERGGALVAGVQSGTSADGIDVALLRFGLDGPPAPLAFATRAFPPDLGAELRRLLDGEPAPLARLARLSRDLGRAFGGAARSLAAEGGVALDLVGSHGQTVYHHDGVESGGAATLQLGDGDFVAHSAGAPTVSDFRMADIAAGGEGAPLSGVLDPLLFPALERPAAILNLGGIANVTFLPAQGPPLAFDVGPANALLDGLARALLARDFDADGAVAATGRECAALLAQGREHPFFARRPPKSTGRDTFGSRYVAAFLRRGEALGLAGEDVLATAAALVAASVADALERFLPAPPRRLLVCGGGARNRTVLRRLAERSGIEPEESGVHGLDGRAREATFFAHLAVRWVLARPSTEPTVTGARRGAILGKLSLPPEAEPKPGPR